MKTALPVLVIALLLSISGCSNKEKEAEISKQPALTQGAPATASSAGGVSWTIPQRWKVAGERPMRVATYMVPSSDGGEAGECAVFYFGSGQGGDVRSNIDRWIAQFENPSKPVESTIESNGLKVTTVTTTGTFLAPAGPMMESQGKKAGYTLMGAIVEAPGGSVFFKLTGPSATIGEAREEFGELLESLK